MIKNLKDGENKGEKSMQPHRKKLAFGFHRRRKYWLIRFKPLLEASLKPPA